MKKVLSLLLCVVLLCGFAACGKPDTTLSDETGVTTTKVEADKNENTEGTTVDAVKTTENQTVETTKTKKTRKTTTSRTVESTTTGKLTDFGSGYGTFTMEQLEKSGTIRFLGRTDASYEGARSMLYGNTGFVITGELEGFVDMTVTVGKDACAINVVIDGDAANKKTIWVKAGSQSVELAKDLPKGTHTIEVTKGTAHHAGTLIIQSLRYKGMLKAPNAKALQIEFIGDSVTVGEGMYGAASGDEALAMSYNTFDGYAAQVARNLGAGLSTVARCGSKVPDMRLEFLESGWDFAANKKDIVVINMGTNDLGWASIQLSSVEATLRPNCTSLIQSVRDKYGKDTYIIWAYGMMFDKDKKFFKDVVEAYATENNDSRVLFCDLSAARDNAGNSSHPSTKGNDKAATILTQFIKENCNIK